MGKREAFRAVQSAARGAAQAGLDIILPPQDPFIKRDRNWDGIDYLDEPCCHICGFPFEYDVGEGALCAGCLARPPNFTSARAAFVYNDASRDMILSFKHGGRTENLPRFAAQLRRAGRGVLPDADLIVPVPLHRTRRIKRRYNQSTLLGRALARITNASFEPDALRRIRATVSQGGQSASGRKRNVQGAFAVKEAGKERLQGANIVLIDDVMTTGATLDACASVLLRSGANRVDALCLARVIRDQRSRKKARNKGTLLMAKVEMYSKMGCPFCIRAKALLKRKGADVITIPASMNANKRAEMRERSGGANTFPQIFIDDKHIGGCDDLYALDEKGGLDPLLAA